MSNTEFTMPDPRVFKIQPKDQRSALLYQQALKAHNEALSLCETILGLQTQLGDAHTQLMQASYEQIEHNKLLTEAMGALHDAAHNRHPSTDTRASEWPGKSRLIPNNPGLLPHTHSRVTVSRWTSSWRIVG
jgi:hypothetical protein